MILRVAAFNQAGYSVVQAKVPKAEIPWALGIMMVCRWIQFIYLYLAGELTYIGYTA